MSLRKIIGIASFAALGAITVYGMGCSSSTNSGAGTDSGAPKTDTGAPKMDSSVMDTGGGGDSSGGDSGGGDSGAGCPANQPFMAITWAPPTPLHQGLCTPAQVTAYNSSLMGNGPFTSGSMTCDACIQTDQGAAKHGPIITVMGNPQELNFGGCLADETGIAADGAKGGCGNQLNDNNDCIVAECGMCSDFSNPTKGGPTATCFQAVSGTGGLCATDSITAACNTETMEDGGLQICLTSGLVTIVNLWCGSGTTPPADGGADTSTPPGDTGGGG